MGFTSTNTVQNTEDVTMDEEELKKPTIANGGQKIKPVTQQEEVVQAPPGDDEEIPAATEK